MNLQSYNFGSQPQLQLQPQIQIQPQMPMQPQYSLQMIDNQNNQMNPVMYSAPSLLPNNLNQRINQVPGFNVGMGGNQPYYVQPIYIQGGDNNQSPDKKKKKKKKDKKKKRGKNKDDDDDDDDDDEKEELDGKGMRLIEKYLDKQNQLMNRILRDINDDKKLEQLKNKLSRSNNDSPIDQVYPSMPKKKNPLLQPFKTSQYQESPRLRDDDYE